MHLPVWRNNARHSGGRGNTGVRFPGGSAGVSSRGWPANVHAWSNFITRSYIRTRKTSCRNLRHAHPCSAIVQPEACADLASPLLSDVHSLGLKTAQGLVLTAPFYWDLNDNTRAFADRFMKLTNRRPTMVQAGVYSAVLHYLKAVHAAGGAKDALAVVTKMKGMPAEDQAFGKSTVRADGRVIHNSYLFEVKKPEESKGPWDYYKLISVFTLGRRFIRKCAEPIQNLRVPKGCSTVLRRTVIMPGFRSSRSWAASRTASCSQRAMRRSLAVVHCSFSGQAEQAVVE